MMKTRVFNILVFFWSIETILTWIIDKPIK